MLSVFFGFVEEVGFECVFWGLNFGFKKPDAGVFSKSVICVFGAGEFHT